MPLDGTVDRKELDYLVYREEVERSRANSAASAAARRAHGGLADLYHQRIEQLTAGNIRFATCGAARFYS